MSRLRRAARAVSARLGRDSAVIRFVRPAYNRFLEWSAGDRGLLQTVNDEVFRIEPRYRAHFPEVYEPEAWHYLKTYIRADQVCLNAGAHMGIYALALARWTSPGGRIYAFEPNPATRAALERHLVLNEAADRVTIVDAAVSDAPGTATFLAIGHEGFSRLDHQNRAALDRNAVTVRVTSIDAFCTAHRLSPDWITLDIEGFEIAALEGARETIGRGRGRLRFIVEMHPSLWPEGGRERLKALLTSLQLNSVALTRQADSLGDYGIVALEYGQE